MRCRNREFSNFSSELTIYDDFFLQLCVILEPMQELMSRHKAYALSPRDCLKTTLFQKWQRIVAPPGKRGRRTVALHEKHQPVSDGAERPSILIDNVKSVFAVRELTHLSLIFFVSLPRFLVPSVFPCRTRDLAISFGILQQLGALSY